MTNGNLEACLILYQKLITQNCQCKSHEQGSLNAGIVLEVFEFNEFRIDKMNSEIHAVVTSICNVFYF